MWQVVSLEFQETSAVHYRGLGLRGFRTQGLDGFGFRGFRAYKLRSPWSPDGKRKGLEALGTLGFRGRGLTGFYQDLGCRAVYGVEGSGVRYRGLSA